MDHEHTRYWKRRPARAANELTVMHDVSQSIVDKQSVNQEMRRK